MTNSEALIKVSDLSRRFGPIVAVDGVSFTVHRGEVLGFLGPNGAGKSTTMKMIAGFLTPSAGTAVVSGFDVVDQPLEAKRRIGYLPEGAPAYGDMTPLGFLRFVAGVRRYRGAEVGKRIERVVELANIGSVLDQPIDTLSKGFKRRVGIAQALIHDPEVLIMDEPTDGLDPNQKHEVRSLIREMAAEKAIVISTHLLDEVTVVCTRALIIAGGRIVADGTPAELEARSRYRNAVAVRLSAISVRQAETAFGALPDVETVELSAGNSMVIFPKQGKSIIGPVTELISSEGWQVEDIRVEPGHLEDVFREITQRAAPEAT